MSINFKYTSLKLKRTKIMCHKNRLFFLVVNKISGNLIKLFQTRPRIKKTAVVKQENLPNLNANSLHFNLTKNNSID